MNGGYIMIYKNSKKIYLELFACLTLGKPILWYEDKNTCFFIDTISGGEIYTEIVDDEEVRTYGDIILTKGGMTITITAENVVTEVGDIQPTSGSEVTANPTLSGDENNLTGLEVDGVKYAIPEGDSVTANPTLSGDENDLTGLEVNGVKYVIPSGSEVANIYEHIITMGMGSTSSYIRINFIIINNSNTELLTLAQINNYLMGIGMTTDYRLAVSGYIKITDGDNVTTGICHALRRQSGVLHIEYFNLSTMVGESYNTTGKTLYGNDRVVLIQ